MYETAFECSSNGNRLHDVITQHWWEKAHNVYIITQVKSLTLVFGKVLLAVWQALDTSNLSPGNSIIWTGQPHIHQFDLHDSHARLWPPWRHFRACADRSTDGWVCWIIVWSVGYWRLVRRKFDQGINKHQEAKLSRTLQAKTRETKRRNSGAFGKQNSRHFGVNKLDNWLNSSKPKL